ARWATTWCRWRARPSTSATTRSSDADLRGRRLGRRRPRADCPHEPGDAAGQGEDQSGPLEPALAVDELRLEEVHGNPELEEPPVVHARLEPAGRALHLPQGVGRDAGR